MSLTEKQKIGLIGENIAEKFLVKRGFSILDRNYRRKWGELDIVTKKDGVIHFIEVKTVTRETTNFDRGNIYYYRPEENVHPWKLKRLARITQTYLLDKNVPHETDWQIDVLAVFLDLKNKKAKFRLTENVIM